MQKKTLPVTAWACALKLSPQGRLYAFSRWFFPNCIAFKVYSLLWSQAGESSQVETVSEENKGLIWTLLKQLRPGMDLSKVVLPTFILEPRSFLDKLSDYYYHADLLSQWAPHYQHYCSQTHFTDTGGLAFIGFVGEEIKVYICFRAVVEDSAYSRMKQVLRWYLSGFYKKPKVSWVKCSFLDWESWADSQ